jgi:hypothetical protein
MIDVEAIGARAPLSPWGRGREAMTYGRVRNAAHRHNPPGAAVSHLAELVRGYLFPYAAKAPSSGPSGHLLPKGRRGAAARLGARRLRQSGLGGIRSDTAHRCKARAESR